MASILLVDDDQDLTSMLTLSLKLEQYFVQAVNSGPVAKEHLLMSIYDLIILDWNMPEITGLELCRLFRAQGGKTPILFLTGRSDVVDKEEGLNAGGDDYLTKPFHVRELLARIRALMRRRQPESVPVLRVRGIELDAARHKATMNDVPISLTPHEFKLLNFFMTHPNEVFSYDSIMDKIWQNEVERSVDALRQYVLGLRKALKEDKGRPLIRTIHGIGYRFEP